MPRVKRYAGLTCNGLEVRIKSLTITKPEDVENCVRGLLDAADGDIDRAQRGIIYLDEIDKVGRKSENPSITRDVGGEGVQQALLKIVEGSLIEVAPKGQRKHPNQETTKIDTSKILFIVGGSFEGIQDIIKTRLRKSEQVGLGFGSNNIDKSKEEYNKLILSVEAEDLRAFGMIPEFVGRFPILCPMQDLTEEALCRILTEPKNALVKQYQELMKIDGIELEFQEDALKEIAAKALKRKTGARGLRGILEDLLLPHMYSMPDMPHPTRLTITREAVLKTAAPIIEPVLEKAG